MNKYQEAIKYLSNDLGIWSDNSTQAIETLQELVDKETPKKVIEKFGYACPRCDAEFVGRESNYCSNCGQKFDWKGE